MIGAGWRRLGIAPAALVILGLAVLALLLSRGAGSGWLVVIASAYIGGVLVAAATAALGLLGLRVVLEAPTDAVAGQVVTFGLQVPGLVPQVRTVTLLALDGSTHATEGSHARRVSVLAEHRGLLPAISVEVRGGLPLGLMRPARRFTIALPVPFAVAPVPAVVSLLDALGEDDAADVRTVRTYIPGDAARHVHWRSTARRGELMVREFDTTELLRGAHLQVRVTLSGDAHAVEAAASEAAGLAFAALDAGLRVELLTCRSGGTAERSGGDAPRDRPAPRRGRGRRTTGARQRRWCRHRGRRPMTTLFDRVREANRTISVEDSIAFRVAVFVAVVIATAGALDLGIGGPPAQIGCVIGLPGGYVLSYFLRHRSRGWLKALLAVAALGAFVQFLGLMVPALGGQVFGLQSGLVGLLLWVQVLHSMDLPSRRDLLFSLATSGVLMIVTGALATEDSFGVVLVLWLGAAMTALAIANLNDVGLTRHRARRTRSLPAALVAVAAVGLLVLGVLPPARVLAFGLPSRAVGGGINTGGDLVNPAYDASLPASGGRGGDAIGRFGYFGYTETLDLGVRGRPDNTLVMRVRAAAPDFWRAQSFDRWDGQRWSISDTRLRRLTSAGRGLNLATPFEDIPMRGGDELIQTFFIEKMAPNIVFAAASPTRLYWPFDDAYQLRDGTVRGGDTMAPGTVYSVVSSRLPVTPLMLRAHDPRVGDISPDIYRRYTALPAVPTRVRELAQSLFASAPSTYDAIQAMTNWIATHTQYSLNPPRLGAGEDAVEQFLFEDQRGFCEQIATSLVVMLRSVGIPARLTAGYAAGRRNPFSGLYEVRASDAHAYAEVLFPGVGWQAFDPTADVPLAGESGAFPSRAAAGLAKWVSERLPTTRQATTAGIVVAGLSAAVFAGVGLRRQRQRSWLEVQLARLQRHTGIALEPNLTLPAWLAGLPPDDQARYGPVVSALEHEAWADAPLDAERRRLVEQALG